MEALAGVKAAWIGKPRHVCEIMLNRIFQYRAEQVTPHEGFIRARNSKVARIERGHVAGYIDIHEHILHIAPFSLIAVAMRIAEIPSYVPMERGIR